MSKVKLKPFQVVGLSVRTSNQNGQAAEDIPALWQEFMTGQKISEIPNKASSDIYAIYTNYEGDHNLPYDFILGCKVLSTEEIPTGMVSVTVPSSDYEKITVKGDLDKDQIIFKAWQKIWESGMNRAYEVDFEIYDYKSRNMSEAEVDIFISN